MSKPTNEEISEAAEQTDELRDAVCAAIYGQSVTYRNSRLTRDTVDRVMLAIASTKRESGWQPKHEYHHYGMGIVRSRLLEDHVYLQGKNGDVWRIWLEMDGRPSIECIERNAVLPSNRIHETITHPSPSEGFD